MLGSQLLLGGGPQSLLSYLYATLGVECDLRSRHRSCIHETSPMMATGTASQPRTIAWAPMAGRRTLRQRAKTAAAARRNERITTMKRVFSFF